MAKLSGNMRRFYWGGKFQNEVLLPNTAENRDKEYNAFEEDIAVVNIFFGKDSLPEYETDPRMTIWDFISNIGGLLGVCAGISILSCAEIFYWLVVRMITH